MKTLKENGTSMSIHTFYLILKVDSLEYPIFLLIVGATYRRNIDINSTLIEIIFTMGSNWAKSYI